MTVFAQIFRLSLAVAVVAGVGCSREKYRDRADKDVEAIISQKNIFPQWEVKNWHVYPDQRARFADPFKADAPPFPVDDYAAQLVSPNPQKPGKGGSGRHEGDGYLQQISAWDAQNRAEGDPDAAPPKPTPDGPPSVKPDSADDAAYKAAFATNERTYKLKLEQTVELGLFNSREFQDRREDLYLAALPVSLERFGFSAQFFAAENLIYSSGGADSAAPGSRWSPGTEVGLTRRMSSGAELLVRLANQIVVTVGGGRPTVSVSDFGLSLTQPFLRGGGFAVTLEALTQAERTLLYALRSYARFRNLFYFAVVGGGDYTNNPYGLQGLAANLGRGVGANLTARSVGYLPTVLRAAVLANEKKNVATIESYLGRFQNLKEGDSITELQVFQVEQRLLQSRAAVLRRTQEYVDNLDNFKLQLGVPATLPVELDESPLRPIRRQLQRYEGVYDDLQEVEDAANKFDPAEPVAKYRDRWTKLLTGSDLVRGTAFARAFPPAAEALRKLTPDQLAARLKELGEKRQKLLDERVKRQAARQPQPEEAERAIQALEDDLNLARFEEALRAYEGQPWLRSPKEKQDGEQAQAFRRAGDAGVILAVIARGQRLDAIRAEWPELPGLPVGEVDVLTAPLDDAYARTAEAALNNRFDLMNARAQVVDLWRRVNVTANSLQGVFDVGYDLTTSSPAGSDQPFSLGGSRTLHAVRLRLEPPFARRAERNNYRAALIAYQRQRRSLQAVEDNIVTDARTDLRALRQLAQTYRVQRKAVELAYIVADNALSEFTAPPDPQGRSAAGDAAALTQQLLGAQAQLVQAQNDLYTTYITYLTTRMEFFLDLELFSIDDRGVWTDDAARQQPDPAVPGPVPPAGTGAGGDGDARRSAVPRRASRVDSPPAEPTRAPSRRRLLPLLGVLLVVAGGAAAAGIWLVPKLFTPTARPDLLTHRVEPVLLPVTVVERGTLESAHNLDVTCKVKAGARGTFASTIKRVIDDGTEVRKGQWLMDLDDSSLKDQEQTQNIAVARATSAYVTAKENLKIQLKVNDSDIASKLALLQVAELDLEKFLGYRREATLDKFGAAAGAAFTVVERGEYRMKLDDVSSRLKLAESDLQAYSDRAAHALRSVQLKYMTASQAKVEQSKYESQKDTVAKLTAEKFALESFTRKRDLTDLASKVDVARATLEQAELQAVAKLVTQRAELKTAESVLDQEEEKMNEIKEQLAACQIFAPQDGMVVYYKESSNRFSGSTQGLIAVGEQVKEGQKLLRIPDLKHMQVNVRIHEALIDRVEGDKRQATGVVEGTRAGLLANPHAFSRLLSQTDFLLGGVRDSLRDKEYIVTEFGHTAGIRVDAKPDQTFNGRVRSKAGVASQQDWMSADVKVYQTIVSIDDSDVTGLRPDMSAEVTIQTKPATDKVLAVPIQAVLGGAEAGATRQVYVLDAAAQPQKRTLKLGAYNDRFVEVKEGLAEGEVVVLNPKVLDSTVRTREEGDASGRGATKTGRPGGDKGKGGAGKGGAGGAGAGKKQQ